MHSRTLRAALLALALTFIYVAPAAADGNPDISLDKEAPERALYGTEAEVTLTASNPAGQPTGYNLSFRDVLPPGVSYVANSAPARVGQPQVIPDSPSAGSTTLIWPNVADLTPSSNFEFTYRVSHDPSQLEVSDEYTNQAGAYINCDPRYVPDFDATGAPVQSGGDASCGGGTPAETSYTGSATDSATTELTAIEVHKSEPSPEDELLRGLHDHQTIYTIEVENNHVNPTTGLTIEDYIPAGLEFLGCGDDDNTSDAPTNPGSAEEYPGSGPINPGNAPSTTDCIEPDVVETVQDPPGRPAGVYTHVVWRNVADLASSDTFTLEYVAAIPIRANTMDWNGAGAGEGTAPADDGAQGSNLDNNSGPETSEDGGSEPAFTNTAIGSGDYQDGSPDGIEATDEESETVIAEDLRILKTVDDDSLAPGSISHWTLNIATGEYRYVDDLVVTDTLGDGYCPLGSSDLEVIEPPALSGECAPQGGEVPTSPYTSTTENADGTWTISWDQSTAPELARIDPSDTFEITFPALTRAFYQQDFDDDTPVLANDGAGNDVSITGNDFIICAPGAAVPCPLGDPGKIDADEDDGTPDRDVSSEIQEAAAPSIDKRVSSTVNAASCPTGPATYVNGPAPVVRPGQTVCYSLRMNFPDNVHTGGVTVSDFIPPGTAYVPGSAQLTPDNSVGVGTALPPEPDVSGSRLSWPLEDSANSVDDGQVFEVVFAVSVGRLPTSADGDLLDNLMKASYSNTPGESFPLRDSVGFELEQPEVSLLKGVLDINGEPAGGRGVNVDGGTVAGGDVVTYRVDVANDGAVQADATQVWDVLPAQISCSEVSAITTPGGSSATCNATENRIEWTGLEVPAEGSVQLNYSVTIPDGLTGGDVLDNTAGVRQYQHATGNGPFTNVPSGNIDETQEPLANAPEADDPSSVTVASAEVTKSRTTQIDGPGNNEPSQATIGERVDYTVTATIPEGTTLYGSPVLSDPLGGRKTLVPGSASATLDADGPGGDDPVALPTGGLTLVEDATANTVRIDFPASYDNASSSGDDIIEMTFSAIVDDDYPDNQARGTAAQRTLPNTATLAWENAGGDDFSDAGSVNTTIVEPQVSVGKASNATGLLTPGQTVRYTLTGSNAAGASTANDAVIVDVVPAGLTPVNGTTPVADGGTVDPDGGTWDEAARTITWPAVTLDPGDSVERRYDVLVDPDAVGAGTLTNSATITTASLAGGVNDSGRRTPGSDGLDAGNSYNGYRDDDALSLQLINGAIGKESSPEQATIGDVVTHTLTVSIPASIAQFDTAVVDVLPDGLVFDDYVSAECTDGCSGGATDITAADLTPVDNADGTTTIGWSLGDIASAPDPRTVVLTYTTRIGDTYNDDSGVNAGDALENTATLAFNQSDEVTTPPTAPPDPDEFDNTEEDVADVEVIEPAIEIDKGVSGDPDNDDSRTADPGSSFTYTLTITNTGDAPAYDVAVADRPDAELTNVELGDGASFNTDDWTAGDPDMRWVIPGPIEPGSQNAVTLTYTADLVGSDQLSDGDVAENTVDVPSYHGVPEDDQDPGVDYREYDDVDPDTVDVIVHMPALTVDKTTGAPGFPDTADAEVGESFSWHVVLTNPNAGSTLLAVDALDTLPPNWSYVAGSATISGTGDLTPGGPVEPQITTDDGGDQLQWTDLGAIEGGETIVIDFEAVPSVEAAIDPGLGPDHENQVEGSGEDLSGSAESADGPYEDSDDATATLLAPEADLGIEKTAGDPAPTAGTDVTWTLTATNNGPKPAPDVVVTDELPAGLSFVSATPEQGGCDFASGTLTCELGAMDSGAEVLIQLVTTVGADQAGETIVNPAEIGDEYVDDTNPDNDESQDEVTPGGEAHLTLEKELLDELRLGADARYRLEVTNDGPSDAHDVVITDELPEQLSFKEAPGTSCAASGQTVTCPIGDLPVGESAHVEISVTVVEYTSDDVVNSASAEGEPDEVIGDEDESGGPVHNTDLALRKLGPRKLKPGKRVTYRLRVSNVGDFASGGTAVVRDRMPKELTPTRAAGNGWSCDISGRVVECDRSDSLASGDVWPRILIKAKVAKRMKGRKVKNVARVTLPGDPRARNNTGQAAASTKLPITCRGGGIYATPEVVKAGKKRRVRVHVVDRRGKPVKGVTVKLRAEGGKKTKQAKTNRRGRATFKVRARTGNEVWVAKAKGCGLKVRILATPPPVCRAAAPDSGDEADAPTEHAEPLRRRC